MKKQLLMPVAALLFLGLWGCGSSDSGRTEVSGRVEQEGSGQALAGAEVQLYQAAGGPGWGAGGYRPVAGVGAVTSDAQGRFSLSFEAEARTEYVLKAGRAPGYHTNPGSEGRLTGGRRNRDVRVGVTAPAWVQLDLVDEAPKSNVCVEFPSYSFSLTNPRDTSLVFIFPAAGRGAINWIIQNVDGQSSLIDHQETFTLLPMDTVHYRLAL